MGGWGGGRVAKLRRKHLTECLHERVSIPLNNVSVVMFTKAAGQPLYCYKILAIILDFDKYANAQIKN